MKRFRHVELSAFIAAVIFPFGTHAASDDFVFTYDYEGATHDLFGIQRCVQIDAAMLLKDQSLVGSEILGVSVDIPSKEGCECDPNATAWLSTDLQVDGEFNLPDLQETAGTIRNYGTDSEPELRLDITFPESYRITEDGVYVGYSVTVTDCNIPGSGWISKYPIVTVCDIDKPSCFMIHCTKGQSSLPQKYPEWVDLGKDSHQALAMRVLMRGTKMENAASLNPLQTLYVAPGSSGQVYTDLNNHGTRPISSIEYSYTIGSEDQEPVSFTEELTLDTPIQGQIGAYTTLDLPFQAPDTPGKYSVEVRVDRVNHEINEYSGTSVLDMEVVPFLPVNRPLVEDYTGLWCGYCPALYVAVKRMHDKYGEGFLSIAYHIYDCIHGVEVDELPSPDTGLPRAYINDRNECIDNDNMEFLWLRRRRELAPAEIGVDIFWNDAEHTALRAESSVRFVYDDPDADYRLTYALIEDNMSDPRWAQANEYTNSNFEGPYWDLFCGQPFRVNGLVYDDVIVSFPFTRGIEGSLPSQISGEKEYRHDSILDLNDGVCKYPHINNYGENIIKDPGSLRVVALLIDGKTGKVCNAATSGYSRDAEIYGSPEGVELMENGFQAVYQECFLPDGTRLNGIPEGRPVIVVSHMADGSVRTEKIINHK